jgi:O-antigen ligase
MGVALCLGFAVFGITELMFRGMRTVGFYTMFVALFLVLSEPGNGDAA